MRPELKTYYLLQFAYWLQQLLVLALRLEKPRTDFTELCLHVSIPEIFPIPLGAYHWELAYSFALVVSILSHYGSSAGVMPSI